MRVGAAHVLIPTIVNAERFPRPLLYADIYWYLRPFLARRLFGLIFFFIAYSVLVRDLPETSITELAYDNFN